MRVCCVCVCAQVCVNVCYHILHRQDDYLGTADVGMTQAVVMRLVDPIKGRGHHVYMENYYTSPQLFSDLRDNGFGACGTVRVNRCGLQ